MATLDTLRPLAVADAGAAAALHYEGQPGTFLSRLGLPFLRALYWCLAQPKRAFGFAALRQGRVVGVVVGTDDTGALFRDVIGRSWWRLAIPVGWAMVRQPALWVMVWRTLSYPAASRREPQVGELLFIGVERAERRQGIGGRLLEVFVQASRARGLWGLTVAVDAANAGAMRFYERHGFVRNRTAVLYGRPAHFYCLHW